MNTFYFFLKRYTYLFFFFFSISLIAQTDSLTQKLTTASKKEKIEIYQKLALSRSYTDPEKATEYALKGLELLKDKNSKDVRSFYFILGKLCNGQSEYKQALFYYNKTIEIAKGLDYDLGIARTYQNMGLVHLRMGEYNKALDFYLKTAEIYKKEKENKLLVGIINNIGSLYSCRLKDDKNGLLYYNKALKLSHEIDDSQYITTVLINMGEMYMRQNDFEKARKTIQESIDIAEKRDDYNSLMVGLNNLSAISIQENKLEKALAYTKESLKLRKIIGQTYENATEYLRLAEIYEKIGDTKVVISYYDKALAIATKSKVLPQLSKVYESLHDYYSRQKKYKKGYEYLLKFNKVKDSLSNEKKHEQLKEIQAKFDIESKEKEVQLLTNENKIKTLENKNQQTIQIVLLIGLIGLTIVASTLFYSYKNKQKTNRILEEKNKKISQTLKDREILLKEVHHRVKNNLQIVSSLLRLQHKFGDHKSSVEIIQEIQNKIQAMAIIHERLYMSSDLSLINLETYLENLLTYFKTSYDLTEQNITISTAVDHINLNMDYLVPCGLIINEIIVNSIKYAFQEGANGHISIKASQNESKCTLTIKDTGVGFPEDFKIENSHSLGMQLIQGLTKQIKGSVEISSNPGACYKIEFNVNA